MTKLQAQRELIFRFLLSPIFIVGGAVHFFAHDHMLGRLHQSPWLEQVMWLGSPSLLIYLSGFVLCAGGISLLLGWLIRLTALVLFVTLVPITLSMHIAPGHMGPLLKNVAILGALLHFYWQGAGLYSLDARRSGS